MDVTELEATEGLRMPWHSWPPTRAAAATLTVPLAVLSTPLAALPDVPLLPYDPLRCLRCAAALSPYARVNADTRRWACPLCGSASNPFPPSHAQVSEHALPPELFPSYSTVEYQLSPPVPAPAFVFVVDVGGDAGELGALKGEILRVVSGLPGDAVVGLVSFGADVWVHDLGFGECSRVLVFAGDREISSEKIQELLGISHLRSNISGTPKVIQKHGFLLPVSECEFNFTAAIEDLVSFSNARSDHRPQRATGAALSTSTALLEGCSPNSGGRIMVFTSGPATVGPGRIVETDRSQTLRTHKDIIDGSHPLIGKARDFYKQLAERLSKGTIVLDLFACSLDQVGAAELRHPIETSGGFMVLAESFESEQFRKCFRQIFKHEGSDHLQMSLDGTIEIICSKEVKISGALGPCTSLRKRNSSVSDTEIGLGGTTSWKLCSLTNKTCITFFFQAHNADDGKSEPATVFFIQFLTRYRHGDGGYRLRVTTVARRWVSLNSPEIAAGFDQEAAAAVMARLAIHRAEEYHIRDVIRWLDKKLITFTSKFGEYRPEDASSFQLSSNFSLFPQLMYYLRRSPFIDIFNSTPDETAFFRLMLNREGVVGSCIMIQPTLFQYSFDGPPVPALLDISSVSPDVILLFDSYFHVVIHYGSNFVQWRKAGYHLDPKNENLRKLMEAPEIDAKSLVSDRIPVPKLVKCDQHGSQARFLLARLNPSVTHKSSYTVKGTEVIFTDDVSLEDFLQHLQELVVQG